MHIIMNEQTTKERILDAAEKIILERSFHSVGLKQILDAAKVPKGSFYHYFGSKEQFGVEMLKHYMDEATARKYQILSSDNGEPDPLKRLETLLDGGLEAVQAVSDKFPCLALKLSSEVSDLSDAMRLELAKGFEEWITLFQEILDEAKSKKMLAADVNSPLESQLIHDLMTGSIHRAIINRSPEPVRCAVEHLKSRMRSMRID